jgi:two-component system cell cycle sensor histidine kinase/response regulator CckA
MALNRGFAPMNVSGRDRQLIGDDLVTESSPLMILHLEDSPYDRELVRRKLQAEGFQFDIVYAATLNEFEQVLGNRISIDVVLLDYSLPSCDGMAALKLAHEKRPETPTILLSGTVGEEKAVEIMKAGATDYLLKDHLDRLGLVVRRALREAKGWAERRQAEEALRKSEARLTNLIGIAIDAIISVDADHRIEIFNKGAESIFGYRAEEVIGKTLDILLPQRFVEQHRAHVRNFADSSEQARLMGGRAHVLGRRKNGSEFPAEASISKQSIDGRLVFTVILRDVTERKQAEAALTESVERYRTLFDSMDEGYCVVEMLYDASGKPIDYRFVEINPAFEKQTGLQNALGKTIRQMVPDHDAHWFEIYGKVARTGEPIRFENPAEAMRRYYDVYAFRIGGPGSARVGILFNDISARKLAEETLREHASLLDKAHDAILVWDIQQRITYWNKGAEAIYGWAAEEALGSSLEKLLIADPHIFEQARESVMQKGEWRGDLQKVAKDGRILIVAAHWTLMRDNLGQPKSILDINTDITEHRSLEKQLQQAQKMEAVGRLAGGVAHDFNNLLTIILGHGQLMAGYISEESPLSRHATEIRKAGERAAGLTRQLLAFSRKQVLQPRVLDLNSILTNTQMMLQRLIGEDIEFVTSLSTDLGLIKADPVQIEQIIMNLAVNARDAMPHGGKLIIQTRNVVIDQQNLPGHVDFQPGEYVLLSVIDTGSGIDSETLNHIFEPFFTTKEEIGTGLGLSTVYGIVKQSAGFITVDSRPREGATFMIYLPRVFAPVSPAEFVSLPGARGHETILLVEDDEDVREVVRQGLEQRGYAVLTATTTSEALELSRKHRSSIDLLITDVVMPGHSGPELAGQIVRDNSRIKVLFISGYTNDMISLQLVSDGAQLLEKPFSVDLLTQKVQEILHTSSKPSLQILVVDDEEAIRSFACAVLEEAGHKALPATNGVDARRMLERLPFDILITDLHMPYKDGIELIVEVRRDWPELKIIAISGIAEALDYVQSNLKDVAIVRKPLSPEDLVTILQQVA